MRFSILCASTALAAGLLLSACSSGSVSQALPGGSPSSIARSTGAQLTGVGVQPLASCASKYYECVTISKTKPFKQEICAAPASTTGCNHALPGTWSWNSVVTKTNGTKFASIVGSFKPNPGNPTHMTISEKSAVASSNGKVAYQASVKGCKKTDCVGPALIGIITK